MCIKQQIHNDVESMLLHSSVRHAWILQIVNSVYETVSGRLLERGVPY